MGPREQEAEPRARAVDFANILLAGPCNLRCPHCIGRELPERLRRSTLERFPLPGLERFTRALVELGVVQVTLTGTNTDPQLYGHEAELVALLRREVPGVKLNLHTNGHLALRRIETFNLYDRATVSVPSFDPETCRLMTGSSRVLDLCRLLEVARIPLKVSTLVTDENEAQIPSIIARCRKLGVRRMVLRRLYGETRDRGLLAGLVPARLFAGQPVYEIDGIEVTQWSFARSSLRCLNLFSDGSIGEEYELARSGAHG